jgi:uncharacterized metal-binding protein YceD (DUF177 family)
MPLIVNLQHLVRHGISLKGELPVEELDLDVNDEMIQANSPLEYSLQVEKLEDSLLVQGRLTIKLDCRCVKCLEPCPYVVTLDPWACHLPLSGEDAVSVNNDCVDLTPHIREDTLLEFPQHPVCKSGCDGLKLGRSTSKTKPVPPQSHGESSSTWSELDKLKLK